MTNTTKWVLGIIAVVILVVIGYSVSNKQPTETGPIKIGVLVPLTGEAASWGQNLLAGAELAQKEINDAGGINGREIKLITEDDQCKAATGVSAINKLISVDKVSVIVGPPCSSVG